MANTETKSEQIVMRIKPSEARLLNDMMTRSGHQSRSVLARSIIRAVLDDDAREHGEPGLPRE